MGTLYIVATPIGHLDDITLRALMILKKVEIIACEDTRHSGILLRHYQIDKRLISFHEHSKLKKIDYLVSELKDGKDIALITDAGTPGVADPAGTLISEALKSRIEVVPIPGVSAVTTILSIFGKPLKDFLFLGFLPKKKGRQTIFSEIAKLKYPIIFLESPARILKTLTELENIIGEREVVIGRELTKKFEEILRGRIADVKEKVRPQGEFIVLIEGNYGRK